MQILLASAKIMNTETRFQVPVTSKPMFRTEAARIAMELSGWSVDELSSALRCNRQIAATNHLRYLNFRNANESMPAVLAYYGQAYKYLRSQEWSGRDFLYAQEHLVIPSFLYGFLRPLDLIHPYRLEGNVVLDASEGRQLFDFWSERLTDVLIKVVKDDDGILIYVAAEEMKRLFDWRRVEKEVRVVQPLFYVDKGISLKTIIVHAKSCRGAMARQIILRQLHEVSDLQTFELDGYRYDARYGDENHPHFIKLG